MAGAGVWKNGAKVWMQQPLFTNTDFAALLCSMGHKKGNLVQVLEKETPTCVPVQLRLH